MPLQFDNRDRPPRCARNEYVRAMPTHGGGAIGGASAPGEDVEFIENWLEVRIRIRLTSGGYGEGHGTT